MLGLLICAFSLPCMVDAAIAETLYSQNALCIQNNCVNPLFPGLNDLSRLEAVPWQCATRDMVLPYLDFCKAAVTYDPALPSPNKSAVYANALVKAQDDAASTMFFYHLNGLGLDAWDTSDPASSDNDCVVATWRMVCYTYFPKSEAGCQPNQPSQYRRPCMSSCHNYVDACKVECCDESVRCTFNHEVMTAEGAQFTQTGYVDQLGPSALCTGAATRGAPLPSGWVLLLVLLLASLALEGCDVRVPRHRVGNWRKKPDYLVSFQFVMPGEQGDTAVLNSCVSNATETMQCNGHGYCQAWRPSPSPLSFCKCDRDWADPECRTRRKSQMKAFGLSMLLGLFGADLFYLGDPVNGMLKLISLGGGGLWWVFDVIRIGAGPVYAGRYRVAADLPHWVFLLSIITTFLLAGFVVGVLQYLSYRRLKREGFMMLKDKEEQRFAVGLDSSQCEGLQFRVPRLPGHKASFDEPREYGGYGATLSHHGFMQDSSYAQGQPQDHFGGAFMPKDCPGLPGSLAPAVPPAQLPPVRLQPVAAEDTNTL